MMVRHVMMNHLRMDPTVLPPLEKSKSKSAEAAAADERNAEGSDKDTDKGMDEYKGKDNPVAESPENITAEGLNKSEASEGTSAAEDDKTKKFDVWKE